MRAHTAPRVGLYVASAIPRMKPPPTHVAVGTQFMKLIRESMATQYDPEPFGPGLAFTGQGEDANQQVNLAPGQQRYLHAVARALLLFLPGAHGGPDPRAQDDQVEPGHHDQARHVQSHLLLIYAPVS